MNKNKALACKETPMVAVLLLSMPMEGVFAKKSHEGKSHKHGSDGRRHTHNNGITHQHNYNDSRNLNRNF